MLALNDVGKTFAARPILCGISERFLSGRVYSLAGQNGAGKTVLLKIIAGVYAADRGEITLDGKRFAPIMPRDALHSGVAYVPQIPYLPTDLTTGDLQRLTGVTLLPEIVEPPAQARRLATMNILERQLLELHLALSRHPRVLLIDEPRFLGIPEYTDPWDRMKTYARAAGIITLIVSHDIDATARVADEILVLDSGAVAARLDARQSNDPRRALEDALGITPISPPSATVRTRTPTDLSLRVSDDKTLTVRSPGVNCVYGAFAADWGRALDEWPMTIRRQRDTIGVVTTVFGHIADRALALDLTIADNLMLGTLRGRKLSDLIAFDRRKAMNAVADALSMLAVSPADPNETVRNLSGGNKQRVAIARALMPRPRLLILTNPSRGLDRRGIELTATHILAYAADGGTALILTDDRSEAGFWSEAGAATSEVTSA